MIILVISLIFIYLKNKQEQVSNITAPPTQKSVQTQEENRPIAIPFEYIVKSVDPDQIILNGERGDLSLPNSPDKITVFFQEADKNIPAKLEDVTKGLKANLIIIPGVSAELYLISKDK